MAKLYVVSLSEAERHLLQHTVSRGVASARTITRARILLRADTSEDGPGDTDLIIATTLDVGIRTVERVRQRAAADGVEAAIHDRPRTSEPNGKLDGASEARLIALACSAPPVGKKRWSLRLLASAFGQRPEGVDISHELVRRTLKKTS
jgi:transposase